MKEYLEQTDYIFGTRVYQKISINSNKEKSKRIVEDAFILMKKYEKMLSFYDNESDVSKINMNAGKEVTYVNKETFEIIKKSIHYSDMTDGLFDITIAPLVKEYGINTSSPKILNENELNKIIKLVNYKDIEIYDDSFGIKLKHKESKIDLGGIAKGYIADKIIEFYKENDVKDAIINLGGNIKLLGDKECSTLWNVGIVEPKKHSKELACSVKLNNLSVVTSGDYERYFICDGKEYNHILNPKSGYPCETDLRSITLITEDSIDGDGLSTPLFMMGKYKASEFMVKHNLSGIMITKDKEIVITKDLLHKFELLKEYNTLMF